MNENQTNDLTKENNQSPSSQTRFTKQVNSKYNGDQSFQNLSALKSVVHQILSVSTNIQTKFIGHAPAGLSEHVDPFEQAQTKLNELLSELARPSYTVTFDNVPAVTSLVFNSKFNSLVLNTNDGQVIRSNPRSSLFR